MFSTLWKFIASTISGFLESVGMNRDYSFLGFKALGYYIVVSVSALVTADMMVSNSAVVAALVAIAGVFIIYTTIAGNLERNRWRAVMNFERKRVRVMRYDGYLLIGSLILFMVTLAVPSIADNPVNKSFRTFIDNVYHTPIIGWIVGFGAIFYMMHIITKGIKATDHLMQLLFNPGRKKVSQPPGTSPNWTPPGNSEDAEYDSGEYIEYEEIPSS